MGTKITLGQYLPGNTVIHKLDPRTKIILMIAFIVVIFLVKRIPVFLIPALYIVGTLLLAKIPVRYMASSLKPIRWLLLIMFVLNLFLTDGDTVLLQFWIVRITKESLRQAVFITLRLLLLVAGTSLLTLTTSPIELTDGLERLMSPLSVLKFPAHEIAMMMTIALRFIPTLMEEVDRIQKAQMSRGIDFSSGGLISRLKNMIPILVPLFVSSFRRADELAVAMESRCYHGSEGRTRLHQLKMQRNDYLAFAAMALIAAATVIFSRILGGAI
ncbi:MAG: energy-coupling factor transporter transmembrane protein EcfT [Clostridia bacterium]|nr:energy-coupling factor transporter transmembrane protein EcfT [Clostridia bacterium]MBR0444923.1 energy-coupling factor transporter transmembrane protein EcfT [Clostridia bacterium]